MELARALELELVLVTEPVQDKELVQAELALDKELALEELARDKELALVEALQLRQVLEVELEVELVRRKDQVQRGQ